MQLLSSPLWPAHSSNKGTQLPDLPRRSFRALSHHSPSVASYLCIDSTLLNDAFVLAEAGGRTFEAVRSGRVARPHWSA